MRIEPISNRNLDDAVDLIRDVFMEFEAPDYSDEGVQAFFDTALYNGSFMDNLIIYGAYDEKKICGVIATRNNGSHIALFFVAGAYHRQGVGRKLFQRALKDTASDAVTVNSSPYAQEIYKRLGFEETSEEQIITGIRFIPMKYRRV